MNGESVREQKKNAIVKFIIDYLRFSQLSTRCTFAYRKIDGKWKRRRKRSALCFIGKLIVTRAKSAKSILLCIRVHVNRNYLIDSRNCLGENPKCCRHMANVYQVHCKKTIEI